MSVIEELEEWRAVPGFPDYEVSSLGNVRSWKPVNGKGGRARAPRLLTLSRFQGKEYLRVGLCPPGETKAMSKRVHLLVLEAFVGPRPANMEGCHNDGDASNNKVDNLRWDTRKANMMDQVTHGTRICGEAHPRAILSDGQVAEIRERIKLANGKYGINRLLAKEFGISESSVSTIKREIVRRAV